MARAVAHAIATRGRLVAEAGTGTGKTFAYLVPALMDGGKVIVSTGTKTLQDQLFERDVPMVRDALGVPVTIAVLKGRANYVCHYHLERTARDEILTKIRSQPFGIRTPQALIGFAFIPICDLYTDEDADDDDHEVDRDCGPFLPAEMPDDTAQDHGAALRSIVSARLTASLRKSFTSFKCRFV